MSQEQAEPLWHFVPLEEYSIPSAPAAARVRGGLGKLWERLRGPGADAENAEDDEPKPPPPAVLDEAAPAPSWDDAAQALDAVLGDWARGGGTQDDKFRVVVGPSGAAADDVVATWARSRRWRVVDPPVTEQILAGGEDWLAGVPQDDTPLVLARLDRFYLRHHDGLELVERLIERLSSAEGRFLVGCGSWSWAYLTQVLGIDVVLGQPLALQALDHIRLRSWLGALAAERFEFRQQRANGEAVVVGRRRPEPDPVFLRRLAAFSRGIPLVAWAAWRASLRSSRGSSRDAAGDETTLWLPDWSELELPDLPGSLRPGELAVLHELLLRGSMSAQLLGRLLPFPAAELVNGLHRLRKARLLEVESGRWRVAHLGYPAAREALYQAGYVTGRI